jgi:hypothetical protein
LQPQSRSFSGSEISDSARSTISPLNKGLSRVTELAAGVRRERERRIWELVSRGSVHFRVPRAEDLQSIIKNHEVPEAVIRESIALALTRMAKEGRLKTRDPVSAIIQRIFPAPGVFDEAEYAKVVDLNNRTQVYKSVLDAVTKVSSTDKPKLVAVMNDAAALIRECAADAVDLKLVFGSKSVVAQQIYIKAEAALKRATTNIDSSITTDYNLDDPEVGLGGWALFEAQKIHFEPSVAKVTDVDEAKTTIIHEATHLADGSVGDKGYYGTPGFEAMSENDKVTNAAHYEEIPKRKLGKSQYGNGYEFKPGKSALGKPLTFEEKVKRQASEYFREAWDTAVDVHEFLRETRKELQTGGRAMFISKEDHILEISRVMHLTIHQQPAATATVNLIDIVLAEGVAHATDMIQSEPEKLSVPKPPTHEQAFYVNKMVDDSIKAYNAITGNLNDDKKLLDWLVKHYKKVF